MEENDTLFGHSDNEESQNSLQTEDIECLLNPQSSSSLVPKSNRRAISIAAKIRIVQQASSGIPLRELSRIHNIQPSQIRRWRIQVQEGKFTDINPMKNSRHSGRKRLTEINGLEEHLLEFFQRNRNEKIRVRRRDMVVLTSQ